MSLNIIIYKKFTHVHVCVIIYVCFYIEENVDTDEAKGFFEGNFSHVYFILYDSFVSAEANLRQRGKLKIEN